MAGPRPTNSTKIQIVELAVSKSEYGATIIRTETFFDDTSIQCFLVRFCVLTKQTVSHGWNPRHPQSSKYLLSRCLEALKTEPQEMLKGAPPKKTQSSIGIRLEDALDI